MINVKVSLVSSFRRHGSAGPKPTKVKSVVASKFSAIWNKQKVSSKEANNNDDEEKEIPSDSDKQTEEPESSSKSRKSPKEYGSHDGNVHVCILKQGSYETDEELVSISNYVTNLTSSFEAKGSFDLRKAKTDYRNFKDAVVKKYAETYGTQLSEKATTQMLQELSSKAFVYTSHQIVITISSDLPIDGGRFNDEDGLYYITIKSKMVYRLNRQLFSSAELEALKQVDDKAVKLTITNIVRIPAILRYNPSTQKYQVFYTGSGTVSALDGYDLSRP